jgi:hypothetical protein
MAAMELRLNDAIQPGGLGNFVEHVFPAHGTDSPCAPFSTDWMQLVPQ